MLNEDTHLQGIQHSLHSISSSLHRNTKKKARNVVSLSNDNRMTWAGSTQSKFIQGKQTLVFEKLEREQESEIERERDCFIVDALALLNAVWNLLNFCGNE